MAQVTTLPVKESIDHIASSINWMTEDYPPYNYIESGEIKGISVILIKKIYSNLDIQPELLNLSLYPWARAYKTLQQDKNSCLFSMTHTQERAEQFNFIGPIIDTRISLISLSDRNLATHPKALTKMRIGVVKNDIGHQLLLKKGMSEKRFVFLSTGYEMVKMLAMGRVDIIAYGENIAKFQFGKAGILPSQYKVISVLKNSQLGFACNKQVPKPFIEALQKSLMKVKIEELQQFNQTQ
ncbi:transporter substrate-binding domain-containing protein [Pseudoalteromonas sp. C2R02]|uniref:substrate-binding periplasmic protein n=1 Tax=Pseudoalteromonas sp. C2R02 TaxID=2841565 RepID=UPI001C082561|nr:transporter substrate-binding domain-containing protein [Pseudoalteromonas sp. C2R02]MBU2970801.1 transporter substrate-binding domain-containing protein [Pseudoalteromonas sp. C2R02]